MLVDDLFRTMGGFMPPEALQLITDQMIKISGGEEAGLLTLGVLLAVSMWKNSVTCSRFSRSRLRPSAIGSPPQKPVAGRLGRVGPPASTRVVTSLLPRANRLSDGG